MPRVQILFLLTIGVLGLVVSSARIWLSWQSGSWFEVAGYCLSLAVAVWALGTAIVGIRARIREEPAGHR